MADRVGTMTYYSDLERRQSKWLVIALVFLVTGLGCVAGPLILCKAVDIRREYRAFGYEPSSTTALYWLGIACTLTTALTAMWMFFFVYGPTTGFFLTWLVT